MAKKRLTKAELDEKRDYAKLLFIKEKLTQKEIAIRIDISQNTISKWANEGNWEAAQKSILLTREEQLRQMMNELDELNKEIANSPLKRANKEQTWVRSQLTGDIKKLESKVSSYDAFNVARGIGEYYRPIDLDIAKQITELFDPYIKTLLRK